MVLPLVRSIAGPEWSVTCGNVIVRVIGDTGLVSCPPKSGYADTVRVCRIGKMCILQGPIAKPSVNVGSGGSWGYSHDLPADPRFTPDYTPGYSIEFPVFGAAGANNGLVGWGWITQDRQIAYGITGSGAVNRLVFQIAYRAAN